MSIRHQKLLYHLTALDNLEKWIKEITSMSIVNISAWLNVFLPKQFYPKILVVSTLGAGSQRNL